MAFRVPNAGGGRFIPHLPRYIIDRTVQNSVLHVTNGISAGQTSRQYTRRQASKGVYIMKGYNTESGYMGYVDGSFQLFACEADYLEWMEE